MAALTIDSDVDTVLQATTLAGMRTAMGISLTQAASSTLEQAGGHALILRTTGASDVTMPTAGTLLSASGTATFTNKTFDTAGSGNSFSINGLAATANTGTGAVVRAVAPTLTGDTTVGTVNKLTLTAPATGATLTITDGKVLTASNTLQFTGTDGTAFAFPSSSGTVVTLAAAQTLTSKVLTAATITTSLTPTSNDGAALGSTSLQFSDLFLASGGVINFNSGNVVVTHSAGILTVGTGDLRVTTAGTNTASVVTVGGVQTLTNKTFTLTTISSCDIETSTFNSGDITDSTVQATTFRVAPTTYSTGTGAISTTADIAVITYGAGPAGHSVTSPSSIDGQILQIISTTAQPHVITFTGGTLWDGTAGVNSTVTFPSVAGASVTVVAYGSLWYLISNNGCTIAP